MSVSTTCSSRAIATVLGLVIRSALAAALGLAVASLVPAPAGGAQIPGPESFAKTPTTPLELWDSVDYLVRTGQATRAVPYLESFLAANPSDEILLEIRDRYGVGSYLRLEDDPATERFVAPVAERFNAAVARQTQDPARLEAAVKALLGTPGEQRYGVSVLRAAGPFAVAPIVAALSQPNLSETDRQAYANGLANLTRSAVPAILPVLDAPDERLAAHAAEALGRIGESSAVAALLYPAGQPEATELRAAARQALERLTDQPYASLPPVVPSLLDEARAYLAGRDRLEADEQGMVRLWTWQGDTVVPEAMPVREAEVALGRRLVSQARELDPSSEEAQALEVALSLDEAVRSAGVDTVLTSLSVPGNQPAENEAISQALAAGPAVLGRVLELAMAAGRGDLAATAARLLGQAAATSEGGEGSGPPPSLVQALTALGVRTQLAAALSLVDLDLRRPFPGSSQVVPILARGLTVDSGVPLAIVVDPAPNRGNTVGAALQGLGYEVIHAADAREGFRAASETLNVVVILAEPTTLASHGAWSARDLLTNLRADARTAGIPVLFYGPLGLDTRGMAHSTVDRHDEQTTVFSGPSRIHNPLGRLILNTPRAAFVPTPTDAEAFQPVLERYLKELGASAPIPAEAAPAYALAAATALGRIAQTPESPFAHGLPGALPALLEATRATPGVALQSVGVLGAIPGIEAQRRLAALVLDPAEVPEVQAAAATALLASLQRFGPLITSTQEEALLAAVRRPGTPPARREQLLSIVAALRPSTRVSDGATAAAGEPAPAP